MVMQEDDFFSFMNSIASFERKCSVCENTIKANETCKSNAGWRRIKDVTMCLSCFDKVDEYKEKEMKEIEEKINTQNEFLKNCTVHVNIQNCDEMSLATIRRKLRQLRTKIDFSFQARLTWDNKEFQDISFHVTDVRDFITKFGEINKVKTPCHCGLFIGDGCHPEAHAWKDGKFHYIEFKLLSFGD